MKNIFCQICSSSNMSKNFTYNKMHISCDFLCDVCVKFVLSVLVQTTQKCIFDVIYHVIFCMFLVQLKPCTIIISFISDKILLHGICCMPISDHSRHHHMDMFFTTCMFFSVDCELLFNMCTTESGAICTECCTELYSSPASGVQ